MLSIESSCISYRFRDIASFSSKVACFHTTPCLTPPPSGGTPRDVNVIYIHHWKVIGLLILRIYRQAVHASKKSRNHAKFRQNLTLQQFKVIQGHRSCDLSRLTLKARKWLILTPHPCLTLPLPRSGDPFEFLDETYSAKTTDMGYRMV